MIDEKLVEVAEVELARVLKDYDYCMPIDGMARVLLAYESAKQKGEAEGWRDIESAPKDGTRVLGCNGESVEVIFWDRGIGRWFNQSSEISLWGAFPPSHWRPLPEPPTMLSAGGEG